MVNILLIRSQWSKAKVSFDFQIHKDVGECHKSMVKINMDAEIPLRNILLDHEESFWL